MSNPVSINDILCEMDVPNIDWEPFINKVTGELFTVTNQDRDELTGDDDDLPDWQRETVEKSREVLEGDDFIRLPSRFDVDEYLIMKRFSGTVEDDLLSQKLYSAVGGKGTFRRFNDIIYKAGIQNKWDEFRNESLKEIIEDFLKTMKIKYQS